MNDRVIARPRKLEGFRGGDGRHGSHTTTVAVNRAPHALRLPWQGATARSVDCDAQFDRTRPATPLRRRRGSDPRGDRRRPSAAAPLSTETRGRCSPSKNPTRRTAPTANEVGGRVLRAEGRDLGYHEILQDSLNFGEIRQKINENSLLLPLT